MRIAQVCPYDIDRPGGVQAHIRDTARALTELGHTVTIVAPRVGENLTAEPDARGPLDIRRLGRALKVRFGGTNFEISVVGDDSKALETLIEDGAFDIIHFHTIWVPLLPARIFSWSRSANVATFHDTPANTVEGAILRQVFRVLSKFILPRLDAVIAVSKAPTRHLSAAKGVTIHIVPPCTDLRTLAEQKFAPRPTDGMVQILFLGRLDERKGAKLLLQAYARLIAEGLPVRLVVAGSGNEEAALRRFAEEHQLPVNFLGAVSAEDKARLLAQADIFCAPSPYGESFGIVIAEAMACGTPVVAAANPGYSTVLTGEAARFLAAPGDVGALTRALREMAMEADTRTRLGEWGRVEALRYDCRAVAPKLVAIYQKAIAAKAARR